MVKTGKRDKITISPMEIFIKSLVFVALMALTALTMRPLQIRLQEKMEKIRDDGIMAAEQFLGRKILYGSIGPSLFGLLDIRNIIIERDDGSAFLSIVRLRLSYSLFALIRGEGIDAFQSVRIDRPVLSFDLDKDADLLERFGADKRDNGSSSGGQITHSDGQKTESFLDMLPESFHCNIWNGEGDFSGSAGQLKLFGFEMDASVHQRRVAFQGRWDAVGALRQGSFPSEAAMSGKISGEYSETLEEGSATVDIPSLAGSFFKFKPITLSFFLSSERLEVRKTHDLSPLAISLVYDIRNDVLSGRMEGENFAPQDLLMFTGDFVEYNPWLGFRFSVNAFFEKTDMNSLEYALDLSGNFPENEVSPYRVLENFRPGPASLVIQASGTEKKVDIDVFDFNSMYGDLSFQGGVDFSGDAGISAAPYGTLSFRDFRLRGNNGISGDLFIFSVSSVVNIFADNLSAGKTTLSAVDASFYPEESGYLFSFSALSFKNIESYENIRMSSILLEGSTDNASSRNFQASLRLDSFSIGAMLDFLEPLLPFADIPAMVRSAMDDLSVTTEVFFTTDFVHILYNAPRFVAAYEGLRDILAVASLSGTDRRFDLGMGRLSWDKGNAELNCSVDFSDPGDISFSLGTVYRDFAYFLEGMIQDQRYINIRGSYGLEVYLSAGEDGIFSGFAQGDVIPIPSGDNFAMVSFLVSLKYASGSYYRASIDRFEILGLATPASPSATLRFQGELDENGLSIPVLHFDDGKGALEGEISVSWDPSFSYCRFMTEIYSSGRNEQYGLNGVYRDKTLELFLSGNGMQLSRVNANNALIDGSLRLSWASQDAFNAEALLSSMVWYGLEREVKVSASLRMDSDTLAVNDVRIGYSGLEAAIPFLYIDRSASSAGTEAYIRGNISGRPIGLSLRGDAQFSRMDSWLNLLLGYGSVDGAFHISEARYDTIEASEPFQFDFSSTRSRDKVDVKLSGGPGNMLRFRYSADTVPDVLLAEPGSRTSGEGNFYAALSSPSPVRGSIAGSISPTTIDAQTTDLYVDLASLWRFIPPEVDGVMFPGGIVTASVRIVGALADPEFYGTAKGTSVQILVPKFLPEPICPIPTTFLLTGTEMTFGPVDAKVGQGAGVASAWFRFENWIPNTFSIDINVTDRTPIPYAFDVSGIIARGLASGKLIVAMEEMILTISGDLVAHNTEVSLNANEMAAMENTQNLPPVNEKVTTITNISIRSGRRVEFFWPSADFPMLQANADMGTGIHLTSDSTSRRFTLSGDLKIRSGELFYLERNFYLREGTIFFKEDETDFDPKISARAEIRDRTESGPVTISLIIDYAPLRYFTPRFESNPPLSQLEIYSLLGQNPQGDALAAGQQRNLATSALIDSLAQFMVIRGVQRQVRDFLGLDMLSVRTQVFQNMVLQATGTGPEPNTLGSTYRVGNYFDNSTVFLGKYFGADLFGQAMLSFKYDEDKISLGGLRLEPEIGLEMRNPLFDVRFNMLPLHPQYWFINDVSFSVIWRKSF